MTERFFAPEWNSGTTARLDGSEAHHLSRVLRLTVGDEVELFDGQGRAARAEIARCLKSSVELHIIRALEEPPPVQPVIELATAVPKSDRFRWLVEKATELGVDRLLPLRTGRSVVEPGQGKLGKMRQAVIAACKQCGRNRLMEVESTTGWNELISGELEGKTVLVAHPAGEPLQPLLAELTSAERLLLVIGPEGGLTDQEVEQAAAAGARRISLGRNILRIETAAVALASVFLVGSHSGES